MVAWARESRRAQRLARVDRALAQPGGGESAPLASPTRYGRRLRVQRHDERSRCPFQTVAGVVATVWLALGCASTSVAVWLRMRQWQDGAGYVCCLQPEHDNITVVCSRRRPRLHHATCAIHIPCVFKPKCGVVERDEIINAQMLEWLLERLTDCFDLKQPVQCLVHGQCQMLPSDAIDAEGDDDGDQASLLQRRVRVHFAGVTCNAWSRAGARRGLADSSETAHNVWIAKRKAIALLEIEDVCFVECVEGYDIESKFVRPLADTHYTMTIVLNLVEIESPQKRPRVLCVAVNKRTMAWAGPAGWQQRFKDMTYRSCQTTGAVYFAAEDAESLAECGLLAAKQNNYPTHASLHGCRAQDIAAVVLAGQSRVRLEDYLAQGRAAEPRRSLHLRLGPERRRQVEEVR